MPGQVSDLYAAAAELLKASEDAVLHYAPGGAIDRAYVSPGPPAWDTAPQLTVHAGGPAQADTAPMAPPLQPAHRVTQQGSVNLVTFTITVLRCAATMPERGGVASFPTVPALNADAYATLGDLWAIWNHLATLKRAEALYPPKRREMFFDPAVAVNTSGGIAGWQLQIRVELDGFATT